MKRLLTIVWSVSACCCLLTFSGCKKSSKGPKPVETEHQTGLTKSESSAETITATDIVNERLAEMGLDVGYDANRKTIISVGSHATALKDVAKFNQAFRHVAYRKAMIETICEIARTQNSAGIETAEYKNDKGDVTGTRVRMSGSMPLYGLQVLTHAETYDASEGAYEVAMAMVWSPRMQALAKGILSGESDEAAGKPGRKSIVDWVNEFVSHTSIGPRTFVDDVGDRWLIGAVAVDDAMRRYVGSWFDGDSSADTDFKLRTYAMDAVSMMLRCDVRYFRENARNAPKDNMADFKVNGKLDETGAFQEDGDTAEMLYSTLRSGDKFIIRSGFGTADADASGSKENSLMDQETLLDENSVCAKFRIHSDNPRIKWFVRKASDPLSKKNIEIWVGAIRSNDVLVGEKALQNRNSKMKIKGE